MSDDRRHDTPDRDAAQALEALRRLPRSGASDDARARARAAFVEGDGGVRGRAVGRVDERPRRSGRAWASLLAAAMLGAIALLVVGSMPTEHWTVVDATEGSARAAGVRVEHGTLTTGPGEEVEIQLGNSLRIRLLEGTSIELPRPPGRWIDRVRGLTVASGEIYGTSGGKPVGFPLTFVTDELAAKVTGTTFAVFRTDEASCVCLWEGGITVTAADGVHDDVVLEEQQRVWVYKDGRAPEVLPLDGMEIMKLQMMSDGGVPERD